MEIKKCRYCGEQIRFIKSHKHDGPWYCVNAEPELVTPIQRGGKLYITADGYTTRAWEARPNAYYDGVDNIKAYRMHWCQKESKK